MSVVDEHPNEPGTPSAFAPQPAITSHSELPAGRSVARRWWIAVGVLYLVFVSVYLVDVWLPRYGGAYILPRGPVFSAVSIGLIVLFGVALIIAAAVTARTVGRRISAIAAAAAALIVSLVPVWLVADPGFYGAVVYVLPPIPVDWAPIASVVAFAWMTLVFLSWALIRPVRGLGYLAIVLIAVIAYWGDVLRGHQYDPFVDIFVHLTVLFGLPWLAWVIALWGSRASERRAAQRPVVPRTDVPRKDFPTNTMAFGHGQRTNTMAVLSLVFAFVFSILGVVFGHVALSQISRTGEGGRGLAVAGLAVGYVAVALGIGVVIWQIVMFQSLMAGLGI